MLTRECLLSAGFREIKSDAHAYQLLRKQLKRMARYQQRNHDAKWNIPATLLAIKKGNWYRHLRTKTPATVEMKDECGVVQWTMSPTPVKRQRWLALVVRVVEGELK